MELLPLEALAKWASGKSLGVSLPAINAYTATGVVREFLEIRRTRGGRFAIDSVSNDAEWFGFYTSQKHLERRVAKAILGEEANEFTLLMDALRKPKVANDEAKLLLLSAILACFAKPSGPDLAEILMLCFGDDGGEQSDEVIPEDSALLFCFWVFLPCWFVYGLTPIQLMKQVSYQDERADKAVECIVRLDHRAVSHPVIRRWLMSNPDLAPFKQAKLEKWRSRSPFDKEKSESLALRRTAGLMASLSDLLGDPMDVNDQRGLIEALGNEIPDDLQAYLVDRTNDDFSREIRRHKSHYELPPKPDKSAYESVRALLKKCK